MGKSIHSPEYGLLLALLRQLREDVGLTQTSLAERLGRPQTFVSKSELGERRLDLEELRQLCSALDLGLVEVVERWLGSLPSARKARTRRPSR